MDSSVTCWNHSDLARAGARSAMVVVDMQNGFCHPDGSIYRADGLLHDRDNVVAETAAALARARQTGLPVVYVCTGYRPDHLDAPTLWRKRVLPTVGDRQPLVAGGWDAAVVAEIAPAPTDFVVTKRGFDGFLHTHLEATLRRLGVNHLLVAGVHTNICVETTVRTAFQLDFESTVLADCTTAPTEHARDNAFEVLRGMFGDVMTWREAFAKLGDAEAPV